MLVAPRNVLWGTGLPAPPAPTSAGCTACNPSRHKVPLRRTNRESRGLDGDPPLVEKAREDA